MERLELGLAHRRLTEGPAEQIGWKTCRVPPPFLERVVLTQLATQLPR
jgi:hypothetical protein